MNATQKKLLGKMTVFAIAGTMAMGQLIGVPATPKLTANADQSNDEIIYYDDIVYGDDVFNGGGSFTSASYYIYCDQMTTLSYAVHPSAPSFGSVPDSSMDNFCGAMTGRNVIGFYDRWYTNLIPNYTPGMVSASGIYRYYPDFCEDETKAVMTSLYDLMQIEEVGGTTSANFKSGLNAYATQQGYGASYSSFYSNATSVNLTQLTTAIDQNKVGVLMCSQYNFVYYIVDNSADGNVYISKVTSTVGHMMMVYGYKTVGFYQDGSLLCTKTFLLACSGFEGAELGYIEMNDFSVINEAVIVSIT